MTINQQRTTLIRERLEAALQPSQLEIIDDSAQHVGHAGATGGGHFTINIASPEFTHKSMLQCHRLVYEALGDAMQSEIHALSINIIS
jgi:BolA protein